MNRLLPENPLLQLVGYTQRTSDNAGRAESIESRWHLGLVTNSSTKALYLKRQNKQTILEKSLSHSKSDIFKQVTGRHNSSDTILTF